MIRTLRQAGRIGIVSALTLLATACSSGGFGSGSANTAPPAITHYVALGDGYTAAPYVGTAATAEPCLRSRANYPALVAQRLHLTAVVDVSCTGATTRSLALRTPTAAGAAIPAQFKALSSATDLVTLGIGIEDDNLLNDLLKVCMAQPCPDRVPAVTLVSTVTAIGDRVRVALQEIQAKAPSAYIVVVGYPNLAPAQGGCTKFPTMPDLDRRAVNALIDRLNAELRDDARQSGAGFADVGALSIGHDPCAADAWVSGAGSQSGSSVAFHPIGAEQRAVADLVAGLVATR